MKSHTNENILPANPRFHLPRGDGLFQPIAFAFVTEQMHQAILLERRAILDATPPQNRASQQKLLDRYDPKASAQAFEGVLGLFGISRSK
ncbi:hypothetical protein CEW83_01805 [Parazoarcus communis]|uniref:Uncharacterized protein n=1 Tax=Parazoarcus communis TaxID=41977 RepID=A0A2U8GKY2_9RHOO|nr:hypothetical protein [Parazoarcus communis]AWI74114.1 hypothetical protein CEW83_01805 [Parazoarcus communis]